MNKFKILDQEFEIKSATLEEYVDESNNPVWTLMIDTNDKELAWESSETSAPNVRCEDMLSRWGNIEALQGKTIYVPDAYDTEIDECLFSLYVFEHEDVFESTITFGQIKNNKMPINWVGKCNVNWDGKYSSNLPIEIDAELSIKIK